MILDILKNRIQTFYFSNKEIEQEKVDYIFECLRLAPSKQNRYPYKIIALPNQERFKEWLVKEHTWCRSEKRLGDESISNEPLRLNKQYAAPLLLLWAKPKNKIHDDDNQRDVEIGISSQIAVMSANDQGLGAGFGKCHDGKKLAKMLGLDEYTIEVAVGIGYAIDTLPIQKLNKKVWSKKEQKWITMKHPNYHPQLPEYNYTAVSLGNNPANNTSYYPRSTKEVSKLITIRHDDILI
jgi:nitroreductase